jgi:hypothetical protein
VSASGRLRSALGVACWTLAVVSALVGAAVFAGGGASCEAGIRASCPPRTLLLVLGIVGALGFGAAGAVLHKPRSRREARKPWEYPD